MSLFKKLKSGRMKCLNRMPGCTATIGVPVFIEATDVMLQLPDHNFWAKPIFNDFWVEFVAVQNDDEKTKIKVGVRVETIPDYESAFKATVFYQAGIQAVCPGSFIVRTNEVSGEREIQETLNPTYEEKETSHWVLWASSILIKLLTLLNCRNIALAPVKKPSKFQKRKGKHGIEWHQLVVVKPSLAEAKIVPHGVGDFLTRQHLCRGHFKHYTTERPLLGKYSGTFWWEPQVRGNREQGVVLKDYKLRAGTEDRERL